MSPPSEAAETLMSMLPPVDWPDLATKQDLAVLRAEFTAEMSGLRVEMHDLLRNQTRWLTAAVLAGMSVAAAVARLG